MKLLAGNSNRPLAEAIARSLGTPLTQAQVKRFADNEARVTIDENVRGEDVFIIQSTSYPANDNLMELLVCIDALKRASARRITAVTPYFGYARRSRPSWWPISSPAPAPTGSSPWISIRDRFRDFSTSPPTTSRPRRRWRPILSAAIRIPKSF
jgi:hypothetical protein